MIDSVSSEELSLTTTIFFGFNVWLTKDLSVIPIKFPSLCAGIMM